jgi:3-methyladenine DNA glycosylase/8-oxoguanine DNA glycosylase
MEKPEIRLEVFCNEKLNNEFLKSLVEEIRYRYNLDLELGEFYDRFKKDETLGPVIKRFRGMRPGHPSSLYEYLIIGVVLQNATVRRSAQMLGNLLEEYGTLLEFDDKKLWNFWEPGGLKDITEDELRHLKVGYRAKSIKRIDEQFGNGLMDEMGLRQKSSGEQKRELLRLYGVGPATVWYILFDVFHRWGIFEHISPWEQKIYSKLFFNKNPERPISVERILKYLERYGEYKHLAIHYIWEDLWWKRKNKHISWLEELIRI